MKRLIFLAYVVIEIAAFVGLAYAVGVAWAILASLATVVLSFWMLRRHGMKVFRSLAQASRGEVDPAAPAADAVLLAMTTGLLIVPGLVTTALGILLMIKPVRALARMGVVAVGSRRAMVLVDRAGGFTGFGRRSGVTVVDGEVVTPPSSRNGWGTPGTPPAIEPPPTR